MISNYLTREKDTLTHFNRLSTDLKYFFYHICCEKLMGSKEIFKPSRGFEIMSEYLVAMLEGEVKRLAIAIPPRNGKSQLVTTALPLWDWLTNPNMTYVTVAHHDDLLKHFQTGRQSIIEHKDYQKCIGWELTTNTKDEFKNNTSGHIISMVMDYVKTGLGAEVLLVDDPMPARNWNNIKACDKVWSLYTSTLLSRLNNKETGKICVVSQRLCDVDIIGRVIDAGYTTLTLQAVADEAQTLIFPMSGFTWNRPIGDVLNPELESLDVLMEIKKTDNVMFQSQYQQRPSAIKGDIIDTSKLGKYQKPRDNYQEIILSVDSASSVTKIAANWGMTLWGKYIDNGVSCLDLLYCVADKYEYPKGLQKIREMVKERGVTMIMVENKSTGLALIPTLKLEGYNVESIQPIKSKEDRAMSAAPFINKGRLRVPDTDNLPFTDRWLSVFIYELDGFGGAARTCDLLDSTTQVINFYNSGAFNAKNFFRLA